MNKIATAATLTLLGLLTSGCAILAGLGVGAAGGAIVADELNEDDGKFDPLEERRAEPGQRLGITDDDPENATERAADDVADATEDVADDVADATEDATDATADSIERAGDDSDDDF